ncbi:MAG: N-acetyltransferase [Victivallales bacterium]|jgi:phosphinothricin acetyltransferase|nr:N-acetyltransferase [Victivallales bacterium]MBT7300955.1 N-acetyltransferase [Victivallales bacterium]
MPSQDLTIRPARLDDLPRLTEIYNHYVVRTTVTFYVTPFTTEQRREWFDLHPPTGPHRVLVGAVDGTIVGYASSSRFRTMPAYDTTVETSIYLAPEWTGRGFGAQLYEALLEVLAKEDVRLLVAGITVPNPASVKLHERLGFHHVGRFHSVGRKAGSFLDVDWYECPLSSASCISGRNCQ